MSQFNTMLPLLCRTSFSTLADAVMQDRLRNTGVLYALASNTNRGNFQSDFLLRSRGTNRWEFEYAPKNCGGLGESIDPCKGGKIENAKKVPSKKYFTVAYNPADPAGSGFKTILSTGIVITDSDIRDYCSSVDSSKETYLRYVASQIRESYINMIRELDRDLAAQMVAIAQGSRHADGTWGAKYLQLLSPAAGGAVVTNPYYDTAIKAAYANLGLSYDSQVQVATNIVAEYWRKAKDVTLSNQLVGVDNTQVNNNNIPTYYDTNISAVTGSEGSMLSWLPGMFHLLTYSEGLRGINYDEAAISGFQQTISRLKVDSADAAIAFALNNYKFNDSASEERATATFIDSSLGTPLVVDVTIVKTLCGDMAIQYSIKYNLVNLPFEACGTDGMTGAFLYEIGCLPTEPTPCSSPTPPAAVTRLCLTANNVDECNRITAGDLVAIDVNGTPYALTSPAIPFGVKANDQMSAVTLVSWALQQAGLGTAPYSQVTSSGVITQAPTAAHVFVAGDVITLTAPCLTTPITYTVADCNPQPYRAKVKPVKGKEVAEAPVQETVPVKEQTKK